MTGINRVRLPNSSDSDSAEKEHSSEIKKSSVCPADKVSLPREDVPALKLTAIISVKLLGAAVQPEE